MLILNKDQTVFPVPVGYGIRHDNIVFTIDKLVDEFLDLKPYYNYYEQDTGKPRMFFNGNILKYVILCFYR